MGWERTAPSANAGSDTDIRHWITAFLELTDSELAVTGSAANRSLYEGTNDTCLCAI